MKTSNLIMLLSGAVLLHSCKGSSNYKAFNNTSSDTALVSADSLSPKQNKLVKTASIQFKVKNVMQTCQKVSVLTTKYNGMIMHHQMQSSIQNSHDISLSTDSAMRVSSFATTADMTIKIPSEKLESFMDSVSKMGLYISERNMDIQDKSLDYLESQLKLNSRKELVAQQIQGHISVKDPSAVLYFKDNLVDEQINNKKIDDQVKYSTIGLNFFQSNTITKEIIANDNPNDYDTSFLSRFGLAFNNGLTLFNNFFIAMVNLWVFLLAGLAAWLIIIWYKRKNTGIIKT